MDKLKIKSVQEALAMAQRYLGRIDLNVELVSEKNKVIHHLANVYRTQDYQNKVGGICYVFEYKNVIGLKPEMFYIYVKCSGKTEKYIVRSIKKENCSLEKIMPGDNFSCLGNRYHYDGSTISLIE